MIQNGEWLRIDCPHCHQEIWLTATTFEEMAEVERVHGEAMISCPYCMGAAMEAE